MIGGTRSSSTAHIQKEKTEMKTLLGPILILQFAIIAVYATWIYMFTNLQH